MPLTAKASGLWTVKWGAVHESWAEVHQELGRQLWALMTPKERQQFLNANSVRPRMIVRQASIPEPEPMKCKNFGCAKRYLVRAITYALLNMYHTYRTGYAEKHKNDEIPLHYRTGEQSPESIKGCLLEILRLKLRR